MRWFRKPWKIEARTLARVVILGLVLFGCTQNSGGPEDPKHQLQEYISKSFSVTTEKDRTELAGYMIGDAKARLTSWSDEQFRQAFMDNKRRFLKLVFREVKPLSKTAVTITYELSYMDQGRGHDSKDSPKESGGAKVTNKKLCHMVLDQGRWLIEDVQNIKELVEYTHEMSLP